MENGRSFWDLLMMAPLAVLLIVAILLVWRGMGRDGDTTNNKAKGGGSGSGMPD